jgi:flagellar assembly protein FliH
VEKNSSPDAASPVRQYVPEQFGKVEDRTLKAITARAEAEGREKGHAEGFARGLQDGRSEVESRLNRLDTLIRELDGIKHRTLTELMPVLVDLALEIAHTIIRREVELDRDIVAAVAAAAALKLGGRDERMILKVNPSDYDTMISKIDSLKETSGLRDITVEPSSAIAPGGCYIETPTSEVDGRIDEQLKEVRDALATALDS